MEQEIAKVQNLKVRKYKTKKYETGLYKNAKIWKCEVQNKMHEKVRNVCSEASV
jgi:hypothetical protein